MGGESAAFMVTPKMTDSFIGQFQSQSIHLVVFDSHFILLKISCSGEHLNYIVFGFSHSYKSKVLSFTKERSAILKSDVESRARDNR